MKVKYNPKNNAFDDSDKECLLPHIMWHVTDQCPLNCKTCFDKGRSHTGGIMSPAQIEHNISLLLKFGVQKIDISGGEPLLYPHLPYLIDCAQKNGVFVTLTTRGIGTPENKEWVCKNWSKFTRLIISIDAGNKDVCDFYAGCSGVFGQTISFCKELKKNGCNNLRINTVVNKCILDTQSQQQLMGLINEIAPLEWCLIEPHPANKLPTFDYYAVSSDEYEGYIESIVQESGKMATTLLFRRNSMYATYWTLYSDNKISRLSESDEYSFTANLCEEQLGLISEIMAKVDHLIP